ncbi:MAG: hypothetical protein Q8O40_13905 [Chloroflexota bacterium]|nr:hypothetical protein [Chloroflexota bacterium]
MRCPIADAGAAKPNHAARRHSHVRAVPYGDSHCRSGGLQTNGPDG